MSSKWPNFSCKIIEEGEIAIRLTNYITMYYIQEARRSGEGKDPDTLYLSKYEAMQLTIGTDIDHRLPMMFMGVPIEVVGE